MGKLAAGDFPALALEGPLLRRRAVVSRADDLTRLQLEDDGVHQRRGCVKLLEEAARSGQRRRRTEPCVAARTVDELGGDRAEQQPDEPGAPRPRRNGLASCIRRCAAPGRTLSRRYELRVGHIGAASAARVLPAAPWPAGPSGTSGPGTSAWLRSRSGGSHRHEPCKAPILQGRPLHAGSVSQNWQIGKLASLLAVAVTPRKNTNVGPPDGRPLLRSLS